MTQASSSGDLIRAARAEGRAALVGYLPVGFPSVAGSLDAMKAIVEGSQGVGVDLIEVGAPYSDPVMDGKTIQYAGTRALERGVRTKDVFTAAETVRQAGAGCVVMTYWNLVERYGVQAYARDLANAGGQGLITPDLTPDEAAEWLEVSEQYGLDRVFLVSPSSTDQRLAYTTQACRGWVYATAVMGVTGTRSSVSNLAPELVARTREFTDLPIGVGLGISNGDQAADVAQFADAAIVGSALINTLIDNERTGSSDLSALRALVDDLAGGVRR